MFIYLFITMCTVWGRSPVSFLYFMNINVHITAYIGVERVVNLCRRADPFVLQLWPRQLFIHLHLIRRHLHNPLHALSVVKVLTDFMTRAIYIYTNIYVYIFMYIDIRIYIICFPLNICRGPPFLLAVTCACHHCWISFWGDLRKNERRFF